MNIFIENETKEFFDFRGYKKLIRETIEAVGLLKKIPDMLEVNVLIVGPETIRSINNETRQTDSVTDVLSFPYFEFSSPGNFDCIEAGRINSGSEYHGGTGSGSEPPGNAKAAGTNPGSANLARPAGGAICSGNTDTGMEEIILGDIMICAERVASQAKDFGHSQKRELAYLVVHSMLHLIGYDHMTEADEKTMAAQAEGIMEHLGIKR